MRTTYNKTLRKITSALVVGICLFFTYIAQAAIITNQLTVAESHFGFSEVHSSPVVSAIVLAPAFWDPVSKTVSPAGNVAPGTVVTYTNTFGNGGGIAATGGYMIDNIDFNLTNVQALPGVNVIQSGSPATAVTAVPTYEHVQGSGVFDNNPAAPVTAIKWSFSPIPPGFIGTVQFRAVIGTTVAEGTTVPNAISMGGAGIPPVTSIPVVTPVAGNLLLKKSVDKTTATVGDVLNYTISATNMNTTISVASATVTDYLPTGVRYVKGTARLTNASGVSVLPDPAVSPDGQILVFSGVGTVAPATTVSIAFSTIIGAPAAVSESITNTAVAVGTLPSGISLTSNYASAKTYIDTGLFGAQNIIVGKIFIDDNDNRIQDNGELGIPKIRIYLEDGTYAFTDFEGKYHFEGVTPALHTVKVDTSSLYPEMVLATVTNQNAGNPETTFVDIKTGGGLYKANFRVKGNKLSTNVAFKVSYYLTKKKETIVTREYHLADRVYFGPGSEELRPDALKILNEYIDILKQYKDRIVSIDLQIEGHTDNQPMSQEHKQKFGHDEGLGVARVQSVKDYLIKNFGFKDENFSQLEGYGDYLPVADNTTSAGKQANRRADVHAFFVIQDQVKTVSTESSDTNMINLSAKLDYPVRLKDMYLIAVGPNTADIVPASSTLSDGRTFAYMGYYKEYSAYLWKLDGLDETTNGVDISTLLDHGVSAKEFNRTTRLYIAGKPENRDRFYVIAPAGSDEQQAVMDRNNITKLLVVENPVINRAVEAENPANMSYAEKLMNNLDNEKYLATLDNKFEILYPEKDVYQNLSAARVIIKYPDRYNFTLKVNQKVVSDKLVGRTIENKKQGFVILDYVGVPLDTGKNIIVAQLGDNFGNVRGSASMSITVAGVAEKIVIDSKRTMAADGKTEPEIGFSVYDLNGNPASDGMFTITMTEGQKIVTPDANPGSQGHQVSYKNGKGVIKLAPSNQALAFNINFYIDAIRDTRSERFEFVPVAQDWFILGQGQLSTNGPTTLTPKDKNAQMQVFAKGTPFDDYLLTLRVDTNKTINTQKLYSQINPDKLYPIYGDSSVQRYEAQSQGPIFARLERANMYLQYGDYSTGLNDSALTTYNRSFSGVKGYYKTNNIRTYIYQATTSQAQVRNILPANGTSGPYVLQFNSIVENSERITIESRDRFRQEIVVSSVTLTRYDDYNIDYINGRILFNRPVSVTDIYFNPQSIVVLYETNGGNASFNNMGGRVAYDFDASGNSTVGVTAVSEDKVAGTSKMYGVDTTMTFGNTKVKAEYGTTSLVDLLGNASAAGAYSVKVTSRINANLSAGAEYQNIGVGYANLSLAAPDVGTEKYAGNLTYTLQDFKVSAQGNRASFITTNITRTVAGVSAEKTLGIFRLGLGYDSTSELNTLTGVATDSQIGKANVGASIGNLSARLSREQVLSGALTNAFANRTQMGLDYKIQQYITATVTHEISDGPSGSQALTRAGLSSQFKLSETMTSYANYGIDSSIAGQTAVAKVGLRDQVQLTEKLSGDVSIDRGQVLSGAPANAVGMNSPTGDYTAYSVSGQYLEDKYKVSARVEQRIAQGSNANLYTLGYTTLVNQDLSALLNETYSQSTAGNIDSISSNFSMGLAYRPVGWDSFNALLKLSSVNSSNSTGESNDKVFGIADFNYQPISQLVFQGRYGLATNTQKLGTGISINTTTTLIGARFNYELSEKVDAGLHYSSLNQVETATALHSFGVHAGYNLMKDFWVELGYNVDGYSDTAFNTSNTQQGFYVDMRFKFDENTFGLKNKTRVFSADTKPLNLTYRSAPVGGSSTRFFSADASTMKISYGDSVANLPVRNLAFAVAPSQVKVQYVPYNLTSQIGYEIRKDAFKMFQAKQALLFSADASKINVSYGH